MKIIVQLIEDLSYAKSLDEIIEVVRKVARQATGADGATFVLRDKEFCFYAEEDAIGPLWKGKRFPLTACISGWCMLNKKSVAIFDIYKDPRIPHEAYRPTFVKSLAMVPIRIADPIGAIGNYWAQTRTITNEEIQTLQTIANVTSVAIENVQLVTSLKEHVRDLEEANQLKTNFLNLISHELRTPLNSILGWAETLSDDQTVEPETLKAGLKAIHKGSKDQLKVIEQLLDASHIVLGNFSVSKKELDFAEVVKKVITQCQQMADKKKVQIVFKQNLKTAFVNGDVKYLSLVVKSYLDNAIQFSKTGDDVLIDLTLEGPSIVLKVTDFGAGIATELQNNIFKKFSKIESYMTRKHGGLGLSLMIAKSIAEAHHGEVFAVSKGLNQGSTFTFSLPQLV